MSHFSRIVAPLIVLGLFTIAILPLTALAQGDDLVGDYALRADGPPALRITRNESALQVSARESNDQWSPPDEVVPCEDGVYSAIFGENWQALNVRGLCSARGSFGLFTLDKGATVDGHTFKTGYFMVFVGGTDVYPL